MMTRKGTISPTARRYSPTEAVPSTRGASVGFNAQRMPI